LRACLSTSSRKWQSTTRRDGRWVSVRVSQGVPGLGSSLIISSPSFLLFQIWVCFNRGVYDITAFAEKHPGGSRIMMAAGGSLEPFWELYPIHRTPHVLQILQKHRIGK
jgi:hypothetical protein